MPNMGEGVELRRYLLRREMDLWTEEGRERAGARIAALPPDSDEAMQERAWREHCVKRMNAAAWELNALVGPGAPQPDAEFIHIEDWRNRDS
jgi:hypothetical protein